MSRTLKITLTVVAWAAIIVYVVWSAGLGKRSREDVKVEKLTVIIADSADIDIIRPQMVEKWVLDANMWPVGEMAESVNTRAISEMVASHDFVRSAKTYADLDGTVTVSVSQRKPIMRFITDRGYNFYLTEDSYIVPVKDRAAHYVPVITGNIEFPFANTYSGKLEEALTGSEKKEEENYTFLSKLINFVKYIGKDDFRSSQIVQINVMEAPIVRNSRVEKREPEIELIPRVGDHVVFLGPLDGYEEKLEKLLLFYRGVLNAEGWNNWNYINLKFDDQVVCSNKR